MNKWIKNIVIDKTYYLIGIPTLLGCVMSTHFFIPSQLPYRICEMRILTSPLGIFQDECKLCHKLCALNKHWTNVSGLCAFWADFQMTGSHPVVLVPLKSYWVTKRSLYIYRQISCCLQKNAYGLICLLIFLKCVYIF